MTTELDRARRALAVVDSEADLARIRATVLTAVEASAEASAHAHGPQRGRARVPIAAALSVVAVFTVTLLLPMGGDSQTNEHSAPTKDPSAVARARLAGAVAAVTDTDLVARTITHAKGRTLESVSTIDPPVTLIRIGADSYLRRDDARGYVWAIGRQAGEPVAWSTDPPVVTLPPNAEEYAAARELAPVQELLELASQADRVEVAAPRPGDPERSERLRFTAASSGALVELLVDSGTGLPLEQRVWASDALDGEPPLSVKEFTWLPLNAELPLLVQGKGAAQDRVAVSDLLAE